MDMMDGDVMEVREDLKEKREDVTAMKEDVMEMRCMLWRWEHI